MKILLLAVDGKLPNIALHKLAIYHQNQGDEVFWNMPLLLDKADKVYISTIFTKSRPVVENLVGLRPDAIVGGTGTWGWFIDPALALPPEIEAIKAKINVGFTSRGCVRACSFCLVPQVEGTIRPVGDIYDIWDGKSDRITLLDNNILALPDHFEKIASQIAAEKLIVDFNQGLDIRLVTPRVAEVLKGLRIPQLRFAFDDPTMGPIIEKKVEILARAGIRKQLFFYVLIGFNTTFKEDLARLHLIRRLKSRAYVMRHENGYNEDRNVRLAAWANLHWAFYKHSFGAFRRKVRGQNWKPKRRKVNEEAK